jgi:hypothetical protein
MPSSRATTIPAIKIKLKNRWTPHLNSHGYIHTIYKRYVETIIAMGEPIPRLTDVPKQDR